MGRKPKGDNPNIIQDRVGERTDLFLCPICVSHLDCFANIKGRCTALSVVDESMPCPFYKSAEKNMAQAKQCYQHLKDTGRSDLISKYIKPLSAMGMLDDEIAAAESYGEQFDNFREGNYQEQLQKAMESGGIDDDLLDDMDEDDAEADEGDEDADEEVDDEEDTDAGDDSWDDGGS